MTITYISYYTLPNFMTGIHDQLFRKKYDPTYNPEDNNINFNVVFNLISTDERSLTIWPNKSISFNSAHRYQDLYYSD